MTISTSTLPHFHHVSSRKLSHLSTKQTRSSSSSSHPVSLESSIISRQSNETLRIVILFLYLVHYFEMLAIAICIGLDILFITTTRKRAALVNEFSSSRRLPKVYTVQSHLTSNDGTRGDDVTDRAMLRIYVLDSDSLEVDNDPLLCDDERSGDG
jgi:hypothetical protein